MQWLSLWLWGSLAVYGARRAERLRWVKALLSGALALSMAAQLWLMRLDGLLSLQTGLPLHLCGLMAVASLPLIWICPKRLYGFSLLLGAPCALAALCFPAVIACSQPVLMRLAFDRLHGLIVAVALLNAAQQKPLPSSPRGALWLGDGYLLLVALMNRLLNANYLFLRAAPAGTPLAPLFERGSLFYVCALELLGMICARTALGFWRALYRFIAKSRSEYSPCSRCTSPCTTPSRGSAR